MEFACNFPSLFRFCGATNASHTRGNLNIVSVIAGKMLVAANGEFSEGNLLHWRKNCCRFICGELCNVQILGIYRLGLDCMLHVTQCVECFWEFPEHFFKAFRMSFPRPSLWSLTTVPAESTAKTTVRFSCGSSRWIIYCVHPVIKKNSVVSKKGEEFLCSPVVFVSLHSILW